MKLRWLIMIGLLVSSIVFAVPVLERLNMLIATVQPDRPQEPGSARPRQAPATHVNAPEPRNHKTPVARPEPLRQTERVTVHRWVDRNGTVHYESKPPPRGVSSQALVFEGRRQRDPAPAAAQEPARAPAPVSETSLADNPYAVYTPEGFEELMQHVDDTIKRLGERKETFEQLKEAL